MATIRLVGGGAVGSRARRRRRVHRQNERTTGVVGGSVVNGKAGSRTRAASAGAEGKGDILTSRGAVGHDERAREANRDPRRNRGTGVENQAGGGGGNVIENDSARRHRNPERGVEVLGECEIRLAGERSARTLGTMEFDQAGVAAVIRRAPS